MQEALGLYDPQGPWSRVSIYCVEYGIVDMSGIKAQTVLSTNSRVSGCWNIINSWTCLRDCFCSYGPNVSFDLSQNLTCKSSWKNPSFAGRGLCWKHQGNHWQFDQVSAFQLFLAIWSYRWMVMKQIWFYEIWEEGRIILVPSVWGSVRYEIWLEWFSIASAKPT